MHSRGFTIIELVMVLVILVILTTFVLVRMPSVDLYRNTGFSEMLKYDLNITKVLSITRNQRYRLVIGANAYQVQDQNGVTVTLPETPSNLMTYPTGITITPTTTIVFDSLGAPYDAAGNALTSPLSLTVTAPGTSKVVNITPQTGFIQ